MTKQSRTMVRTGGAPSPRDRFVAIAPRDDRSRFDRYKVETEQVNCRGITPLNSGREQLASSLEGKNQ